VALTPLARERGADVPATVPAGLLAAAGVLAGIATTAAVTGSVSSPLQAIRRGLDRVGAGDLHAELAVDDAGEVGHIQAGFNRMVVGLRERQRLEDLFGRHVGEQVAQAAMERAPGLGGQLLDASLLFVDVAGSSRLATTTAPERLVEMLNDLFGCIVAAVTAEDGWVNKFEGDAALSVFGVPVDDADHAAHAVRAALAVARGVEGLRDRWPELEVGIGVSTGKVVAGNVGAMERYEFTVVGQPVNEAARLADAAKEHGERLLASRSILDAAGDAGDWEPLGDIALRGIGLVAVGRPRRMA
jgi:adenylate cyclase